MVWDGRSAPRHRGNLELSSQANPTRVRVGLAEADALAWIDVVARSWDDLEPGPPPAWLSNAARTLRVVVMMTLTGVRPPTSSSALEVTEPRMAGVSGAQGVPEPGPGLAVEEGRTRLEVGLVLGSEPGSLVQQLDLRT